MTELIDTKVIDVQVDPESGDIFVLLAFIYDDEVTYLVPQWYDSPIKAK